MGLPPHKMIIEARKDAIHVILKLLPKKWKEKKLCVKCGSVWDFKYGPTAAIWVKSTPGYQRWSTGGNISKKLVKWNVNVCFENLLWFLNRNCMFVHVNQALDEECALLKQPLYCNRDVVF